MKKTLLISALAALALVGCTDVTDENPGGLEWEYLPVPSEVVEGSGKLTSNVEGVTLSSTYAYKCEKSKIAVDIQVTEEDLKMLMDKQPWGFGYFTLPVDKINTLLDQFVGELDESTFVAYNPDGSAVDEMTSYKPGMWVDETGKASGSGGVFFWQWYIWGGKTDKKGNEITYDMDYEKNPGLFLVGGNPSNYAKCSGLTIKLHNVLTLSAGTCDFDISISYPKSDDDGFDHSDPQTALSGTANLKLDRDNESAFPLTWKIAKEGISFEAELSFAELAKLEGSDIKYHEAGEVEGEGEDQVTYDVAGWYGGPYRVGYVKFDLGIFTDIIGKDITTTTFDEFYPTDAEGNKLKVAGEDGTETEVTGWNAFGSAGIPGEWVKADGSAGAWNTGAGYWWMNYSESAMAEVNCVGAFVIGAGPNVTRNAGDVVVSHNICCGIPFTVTIKYVE